ncbi:MAG: 2Fe-2S iron-sulfur cluster binding domain-containing protein [Betaproteobacteria bacterium]|nr:2Fe-2S iron-sulfur cluster binding domain-containing protein [Betaproteobacteria bacterium]
MSSQLITLHINGQTRQLRVEDSEALIDTLRERCELTGSHQGCDTAQCGACTVVVDGTAIKSCNRLTLQAAGAAVLTIEGLASEGMPLHLIQQAFSRHHALQCGYCTPGFVMRALAMVNEAVPAEPQAVRHALAGNLCRCTGYEGIVNALCEVLPVLRGAGLMSVQPNDTAQRYASPSVSELAPMGAMEPAASAASFQVKRPATLKRAIEWLAQHPDARPLAGGQSLLPAIRLGLAAPSHLFDLQDINELHELRVDERSHLIIGAMVSHARVATNPRVRAGWPMLAALAGGIADQQVRAAGTLGGSLANHDPAACWPAGVLASGATIITTHREITADAFFTGLFGTALASDELIVSVRFPPAVAGRYLKFEQPASRFALVGVAVVRFAQWVRVAITGLGSGVYRWSKAEALLSERFDSAALKGLTLDPRVASDDLHAPAEYRAHIAGVLLQRAVADLQRD